MKHKLFLVTGTDSYGRDAAIKKLVSQYLEPEFADFNFEKYDPPPDVATLFDAWATPPFWGSRRVIHAHVNSETLIALAEALNPHLEAHFDTDNILIVSSESLDKRRKALKTLLGFAEHTHCEEIKRWNAHKLLGPWVQDHLKTQGWRIQPDALEYLIDACGTDKHLLESALDKVLTYLDTPGLTPKIISLAPVRELVVQTESDIFLWLEIIARRDHQNAFSHFHALLLRENPNKILSTLGTSLARLHRTLFYQSQGKNQAEIAKTLGLNPYVVKMDLQRWQRFSLRRMEHSLNYLLALQVRSRSSRLRPELALEMWLGDILSQEDRHLA